MFVWREQIPVPGAGEVGPGDGARPGSFVDWGFTVAVPTGGASAAEPGAGPGPLPAGAPAGAEDADYGGLNLGAHVGDDPEKVEANRRRLADSLGVARGRLLFLRQVHGTDVAVASGPWEGEPPEADAVVTATPGLALAVLVADCTPVLLADPAAGVVGAIHAGRPGLIGGVVPAAVAAARELGATDLRAAVGPSVCGRCYEVPADLRDAAAAVSAVSATVSWTGTPAIDIAAGVVDQLTTAGVPVAWVPGCTRESSRFYSYRRSQRTGRFAGVVQLWAP